MMCFNSIRPAVVLILASLTLGAAQAAESPMNNERLEVLILRIDKNAEGGSGFWRAEVAGRAITVITDENADRMRIISPVVKADNLKPELMFRMLQANFDTALDARYSIAKGILWSLYLHPLGSLSDEQVLTSIGQVVNLAATFGTTYSSGGLSFGGGDSNDLIQELLEKGLSI